VTAFTIGHSLTLALAALDVIPGNVAWVEFLIPVTILITAVYNVVVHRFEADIEEGTFGRRVNFNYIFAAIFGLIHGMGFSNYLRAIMSRDELDLVVQQLFAFNIGVELGQLVIVSVVLFVAFLAFNILYIRQREWNLFISGGAAANALVMALERLPF
jgi:hypothetical protein